MAGEGRDRGRGEGDRGIGMLIGFMAVIDQGQRSFMRRSLENSNSCQHHPLHSQVQVGLR